MKLKLDLGVSCSGCEGYRQFVLSWGLCVGVEKKEIQSLNLNVPEEKLHLNF